MTCRWRCESLMTSVWPRRADIKTAGLTHTLNFVRQTPYSLAASSHWMLQETPARLKVYKLITRSTADLRGRRSRRGRHWPARGLGIPAYVNSKFSLLRQLGHELRGASAVAASSTSGPCGGSGRGTDVPPRSHLSGGRVGCGIVQPASSPRGSISRGRQLFVLYGVLISFDIRVLTTSSATVVFMVHVHLIVRVTHPLVGWSRLGCRNRYAVLPANLYIASVLGFAHHHNYSVTAPRKTRTDGAYSTISLYIPTTKGSAS
ncbi:uncharacterized protein EDB91DRAFT_1304666 [Suillus paluster]|uniref:uncharacterized protein n=1 Tax=Suillus paluster TaxID=48578 RepID=UPI001B8620F9|nr:uncharacterized protein EDB91DRAFT_1304666 [Suillus paluster]KAG1731992.1 hypothetical protein EDB91DRAFT_1304666 [Suillus paluster]